MAVRVKWFYHPEETKGGKKLMEIKVRLSSLDKDLEFHFLLLLAGRSVPVSPRG
jgi:hypothetical protein